jgi:hypothetical protein
VPDEPSPDAVRWAERENERRLAEHRAGLHAWATEDGALCDLVERARTPLREDAPAGFPLARGERVVHAVRATLVDCPAMPSGTRGWSFRASRRGYPPAVVEPLRPLDAGTAVVTTDRVVFQGAAAHREWRYDRLSGYVHALGAPYTAFADGKDVSGVVYDPHDAPSMHFALALALAHHAGQASELVAALAAERAAVHASRPGVPVLVTPAEAPRRPVRRALRTVFFGS